MTDDNFKDGIIEEEAKEKRKVIKQEEGSIAEELKNENPDGPIEEVHKDGAKESESSDSETEEEKMVDVVEAKGGDNRKQVLILGFVGIVFLLITLVGFLIFAHVDKQMDNNVVSIKEKMIQTVHYIDLYEVTQEEGYLIYAYGELKELSTVLDQTASLSTNYPNLYLNHEGVVKQLVDSELETFEKAIKHKSAINDVDLFVFRHRLELSLGATKHKESYYGFLQASDYAILCDR